MTTDQILYHLAACIDAEQAMEAAGLDEGEGASGSQWDDLMMAVMEGFQRGWVSEMTLHNEDGNFGLSWNPNAKGNRAIAAYRRRLERAGGGQ